MIRETRTPSPHLPTCDDRPIWDTWMSWFHFPTLMVADELGLFTLLEATPKTGNELRETLPVGPRGCEAMLGILTSLGFLVQRRNRFYLTDLSRTYLLPTSPYYWGGMFALLRDLPMSGSTLREAMEKDDRRTFSAGKDQQAITEEWKTGDVDPEQARQFTAAMHSHSFPAAMGVARWGDFDGVSRILDVGGGSGCFCIALATAYPQMQFALMELPSVCKVAEEYIAEYGMGDRIETKPVDMFADTWPTGYDAMFFSNVFHDWDPPRCQHLARKSFETLPPGGTIYVHEMLLNDTKDGPVAASDFSMNMVLFSEGKQLAADELEQLLTETGFVDMTISHTFGYYSLISARKP